MKIALTVLTYVASLLVIGAVVLLVVLVFAGPHAGLLPQPLEVAVVLAGWIVVLTAPVFVARSVWRRLGRAANAA